MTGRIQCLIILKISKGFIVKFSTGSPFCLYGLVIVVFLSMLVPVTLTAQWEPDRKLSTTDSSARLNENMGQCLAATGDTVHVVWCDGKNNGSAVYYKHSFDGGVTWSPDTRLTDSPSGADFPSVAVSGAIVHVVFRDTNAGQNVSYYKRSLDAGNSWETRVSLGNYYWWPSVTAAGAMVFVALNDNILNNSEVFFRRSTDNGVTWDSVYRISNASGRSEDPAIAAGGGYVHLAWNDNRTGIMQTFYRRSSDQGVTWGPETQLTNSGVFAYCPMLSVNGSNVDLVWADRRNGTYDIYFNHSGDFGSSWGVEKQMSSDTATSVYPVLARDGSNLFLVWWNMTSDIVYTHSGDGGTSWDSATGLVSASSMPGTPFIVAAGQVVHVIWSDQRDGHPAIYYKRNPTGNSTTTGVDVKKSDNLPSSFSLSVFPNPFNPSTTIEYQLKEAGTVRLSLFDILGHEVRTIIDGTEHAGHKSIHLDAGTLPSGVYYARLMVKDAQKGQFVTATSKLLLVK